MKLINRIKGKEYLCMIGIFFILFSTSCGPICTTNVSKKVRLGMSQTEVLSLCGSPTHKEISYTLYGTKEEWIYKGFFKVHDVVFLNGKVVTIHEKGM